MIKLLLRVKIGIENLISSKAVINKNHDYLFEFFYLVY